MHPSQRACVHQQKRVSSHAAISDAYAFFNLLPGMSGSSGIVVTRTPGTVVSADRDAVDVSGSSDECGSLLPEGSG